MQDSTKNAGKHCRIKQQERKTKEQKQPFIWNDNNDYDPVKGEKSMWHGLHHGNLGYLP